MADTPPRNYANARWMGMRIAQLLGLTGTSHIEIVIPLDGPVEVRVRFAVSHEQGEAIIEEFKSYYLMPKSDIPFSG